MPGGAVYVGRPTFWGNPYSLTKAPPMWPKNKPWTRREAAKRYELMLAGGHGLRRPPGFQIVERAMKELEGRDLACWCPLDGPCHADVLLRYANGNRDGVLLPSERPDE
jgi:hypothetical protein